MENLNLCQVDVEATSLRGFPNCFETSPLFREQTTWLRTFGWRRRTAESSPHGIALPRYKIPTTLYGNEINPHAVPKDSLTVRLKESAKQFKLLMAIPWKTRSGQAMFRRERWPLLS